MPERNIDTRYQQMEINKELRSVKNVNCGKNREA